MRHEAALTTVTNWSTSFIWLDGKCSRIALHKDPSVRTLKVSAAPFELVIQRSSSSKDVTRKMPTNSGLYANSSSKVEALKQAALKLKHAMCREPTLYSARCYVKTSSNVRWRLTGVCTKTANEPEHAGAARI